MATALVASAGRLKLLFQPQQECALATSATFAPGSNVGFNCQQDFIGIGERLPCHHRLIGITQTFKCVFQFAVALYDPANPLFQVFFGS
jgi:hypothetical protein